MDQSISDTQELLLLKACQRGGTFNITLAERLYSSDSSAQSAVQKLELLGFIEYVNPGVFKVVKVTEDVKQHFKGSEVTDSEGSEGEQDEKGTGSVDSGSSSFSKQPVEP